MVMPNPALIWREDTPRIFHAEMTISTPSSSHAASISPHRAAAEQLVLRFTERAGP